MPPPVASAAASVPLLIFILAWKHETQSCITSGKRGRSDVKEIRNGEWNMENGEVGREKEEKRVE